MVESTLAPVEDKRTLFLFFLVNRLDVNGVPYCSHRSVHGYHPLPGLYKMFVCLFGDCALVNTTLGIHHLLPVVL